MSSPWLRKGLEIRENLVRNHPAITAYQHVLAGSYNNLGLVYKETGEVEQAKSAYGKAVQICEKLTREHPTMVDFAVVLGATYGNMGHLCRDHYESQNARDWYTKAVSVLEEVLEKDPRDRDARRYLRNAYWGRARVLISQGMLAEALQDWDRAIQRDDRKNLEIRLGRVRTLVRLGEHARAAQTAKQLAALSGNSADDAYNAACALAQCIPVVEHDAKLPNAKRQEVTRSYADRALATLRQAVQNGYKDAAHMKKDTDLDPLRSRPDFQKLLADLEQKATPGTK